jgi:hypothetical protein
MSEIHRYVSVFTIWKIYLTSWSVSVSHWENIIHTDRAFNVSPMIILYYLGHARTYVKHFFRLKTVIMNPSLILETLLKIAPAPSFLSRLFCKMLWRKLEEKRTCIYLAVITMRRFYKFDQKCHRDIVSNKLLPCAHRWPKSDLKKKLLGWGCSSVVECLPRRSKTLCSIPRTWGSGRGRKGGSCW